MDEGEAAQHISHVQQIVPYEGYLVAEIAAHAKQVIFLLPRGCPMLRSISTPA
jgi:hypothetical protein